MFNFTKNIKTYFDYNFPFDSRNLGLKTSKQTTYVHLELIALVSVAISSSPNEFQFNILSTIFIKIIQNIHVHVMFISMYGFIVIFTLIIP